MTQRVVRPVKGARPLVHDPAVRAAESAGLLHVTDREPGIRRLGGPGRFRYRRPDGSAVRDASTLRRIRSLVIPPAWTDVWICPRGQGHMQATGRDARGRKQHRYHPRWREVRDATKYHRTIEFAEALTRVRARVRRDLARAGLPREKVLAAVVRLLETTLIRVGNEQYARQNQSFGLTTFRDRHARINGASLCFQFKGKSGVPHSIEIRERRLANIVKQCRDLPGQELFQYVDEHGRRRRVNSSDVNEYIRAACGCNYTAKDFRTWAGTVLAAQALQAFETVDSQARAKRNIARAIRAVAERLGNTQSVCRKCYVHPAVLDAYLDGSLLRTLNRLMDREIKRLHEVTPEEAAVLVLLRERLQAGERSRAAT